MTGCKRATGPRLDANADYLLDPLAIYQSDYKLLVDSLFQAYKGEPDSIYGQLQSDLTSRDKNDQRYLQLKYLERKLSHRDYARFDSLQNIVAADTQEINIEVRLGLGLLFAIRSGIKGDFEASDQQFKMLVSRGEGHFKNQHDIMLKIREKHAEMWRYDATNPAKAMEVLEISDTVLNGRSDFTTYHRNQLYTLATTCRIMGRYDDALANALILREKLIQQTPVESSYLISVSKVLANIYTDMEDPDEANRYFEEHVRYNLAKNKIKAHDLINFAIQLSRNYQFEKADQYLNESLPLIHSAEDSFYFNRTMAYHLMNQEKNLEAKPYLFRVRSYCKTKNDFQLCPTCTQWMGEMYDLTGQPDSAIFFYKEAIGVVCGKKFDLIKLEDLKDKKDIELYYSMMIRAYISRYNTDHKVSNLNEATRIANIILSRFDEISLSYTGIDRLINFQYFHEGFGYGAHAHFLLWEKSKDSLHLSKTFEYMERCKSDAWDNNKQLMSMNLSQAQKKALNELSEINKKIRQLELQLNNQPSQKIAMELKSSNLIKESYTNKIKDSFPDIFKLISGKVNPIPLPHLMALSDTNSLLIFHWNRLNTFEYIIANGEIKLHSFFNHLNIKDTIDQYSRLRQKVINRTEEDEIKEIKLNQYLYTIWLKPFDQILGTKIVVIPDGPIHNLSLSHIYNRASPERHIIDSYSYSLTAALQPKKQQAIKSILALAYGHAEKTEQFASLPGTIKEVDRLKYEYPQAKIIFLKNSEATKANFLKYASDADLLYLATHAQSDPYNRFNNKLVFHHPNGQNEFLTAQEVISMRLKASNIVLSACETALGSFYRGSGNTSLLKSFKTASPDAEIVGYNFSLPDQPPNHSKRLSTVLRIR